MSSNPTPDPYGIDAAFDAYDLGVMGDLLPPDVIPDPRALRLDILGRDLVERGTEELDYDMVQTGLSMLKLWVGTL